MRINFVSLTVVMFVAMSITACGDNTSKSKADTSSTPRVSTTEPIKNTKSVGNQTSGTQEKSPKNALRPYGNWVRNAEFDLPMKPGAKAPEYWEASHKEFHTSSTSITLVKEDPNSTDTSVCLQGPWAHVSQFHRGKSAQALAGKTVKVGVWCKVSEPGIVPFMRLGYFEAGKPIEYATIGYPTKKWDAATTEWSEFSSSVDIPSTASTIFITLANKNEDPGKLVYFDNAYITIVNKK